MDSTSKVRPSLPSFIKDAAAEKDLFGSHDNLASSIVSIIRSKQSIRILGLLGAWGSGKSTVLNLVNKKIAETTSADQETYFFVYDAWLHQSDPPRRSFLETLINFFVAQKLTDDQKWQASLDRLNRRAEEHDIRTTPTLTGAGKIIGATLLLFPIGLQLIGKDWWDKHISIPVTGITISVFSLGVLFIASPALAASIVFLIWRPTFNVFSKLFWEKSNWTTHRPPHHESNIFSLFVNKAIDRVHNKIIRTPDPTAIEFQETFHALMADVARPNRQFVFVIDNLDRIPEAEAVTMWSTVRGFFLDRSSEPNADGRRLPAPYVILPLDPGAIRRMYGANHTPYDAGQLARSFLDKTFDLTFRIGPPVLSDWQAYVAEKMREVLGDRATSERIYVVTRFYERFLGEKPVDEAAKTQDVTPRMINTLVNAIALLDLQWGSDIHFATLAYYAIRQNTIDQNIGAIVGQSIAELERYDADWARGIAALHYGVPIDRALQVLIRPALQRSIMELNRAEFERLSRVHGFDLVLRDVIESTLTGTASEPTFISNVALLIKQLDVASPPLLEEIYRLARRAAPHIQVWTTITPETSIAMQQLLESCPSGEIAVFVKALATNIRNVDKNIVASPKNGALWYAIAKVLFDAAAKNGVELDSITVPGPSSFYLSVLRCSSGDAEVTKKLQSALVSKAIIDETATNYTNTKFSGDVLGDLAALQANREDWPWDGLVAAAVGFLQSGAVDDVGTANALICLGCLRFDFQNSAAERELQRLSSDATLFDRLSQAHNQKAFKAEGAILGAILLFNPRLAMNGNVGNAAAGHSLALNITATLKDRPPVEVDIGGFLRVAGAFKEAVNASQQNGTFKPILQNIFADRVKGSDIGPLHVADVIARLPIYMDLLPEGQRVSFITQFANYTTFRDEIEKAPLSGHVAVIFKSLIPLDDKKGQIARAELAQKLSALTSDEWQSAIESNQPAITLAQALIEANKQGGHVTDYGEGLSRALSAILGKALTTGKVNGEIIKSCFALDGCISTNSRHTLYKNLRDQIYSTNSPGLLSVLSVGGDKLLQDGQFGRSADQSVRLVVMPLLDKQPDGREWLKTHATAIAPWISDSDPETRGHVGEKLASLYRTIGEPGATSIQSLADSWNLTATLNTVAEQSDTTETSPKSARKYS